MNPYRPGSAQHPMLPAGRGAVVAGAREALDVAALDGPMPRPIVLVGVRGVGKTVVLNEIATLAAEGYGWPTVQVEVKPRTPFATELVDPLASVRAAQPPRNQLMRWRLPSGLPVKPHWRRTRGLVLTIDEVHLAAHEDLAALIAALQRHVPDGWPLVVAVAGLPSLRDPHSSVTYPSAVSGTSSGCSVKETRSMPWSSRPWSRTGR